MQEKKPAEGNEFKDVAILLVDDDPDVCAMLRRVLANAGFEKIVATDNVKAALAKASEGWADLVISDWNMPGLTGIEFLKHIRKIRSSDTLPFIMLTSNSDAAQVQAAITAGVSDYVLKSTAHQVLVGKVRELLTKRAKV